MRTLIIPIPLLRGLVVSFFLLAGAPSALAKWNTSFVQVSLVHEIHTHSSIFCSILPEIGGIGPKSRDLNIEKLQEDHYYVQAGLVQRPDSEPQETEANQISEKGRPTSPAGAARREGCLSVMFWNVENFFDWRNDSTTVSDAEFSSRGERRWTWKRFQAKANAFAKALFWLEAETGRLPDIVGLEEVENAFVLRQLLQKTALRKLDYKYVHYDSPDRRGIDVALLYRASRLDLLDSKPCHLFASDTVMATRDILFCVFREKPPVISGPYPPVIPDTSLPSVIPGLTRNLTSSSLDVIPGLTGNLLEDRCPIRVGNGDKSVGYDEDSVGHDGRSVGYDGAFAVLVNHHPSKYGGAAESEPRRRIAVERLRFLVDSLAAIGIDQVIAGGDFNDTPDDPVFRLLEPALTPLHMDLYRRGLGTIKYAGKWDLIDHIYISPGWILRFSSFETLPYSAAAPNSELSTGSLRSSSHKPVPGADPRVPGNPTMRILRIPFLLTRDTAHSGEKPLRTYTGPRYTGGVSDHLPILLEVALPMDKKGSPLPGGGSLPSGEPP